MTVHADADRKYRIFSEIADGCSSDFAYSVSDDISAKGFRAAAGSGILDGYRPVFDATVVSRMNEHGGFLAGKTNMDEFGSCTFCVTGPGIPRNPFDLERSCGGSSGGAACAASVLDGHVALGTSAGGSVSAPAAFCGVFGLTPSHGRVSRHGQIDSSGSMGPIGILASDSGILRRYLPVISGRDENDPVSMMQPALKLGDRRLGSVAVPKGATDNVSMAVRTAFESSLEILKSAGVSVDTVEIPDLRYAMSAHYVLCVTETSMNLARYCGMRYGRQDGDLSLPFDEYFRSFRTKYFGRETKLRTIMGTYMTLGGNRKDLYLRSLGIRQLIIDGYEKVTNTYDAVVTPTMPFIAPKFAEIERMGSAEMYSASRFAVPPVFCGLPCLSVPCGYADGMPIGMQFVSGRWNEDVLISAAEMWDGVFDVKRPEVFT
jgi:aspartyl-tRNA(Asn)/glutamyl-tRNA(Gln) amidotransferase subunit A